MIEARQIAQKETSCSLLATFHQPLKRLRFSSSCFIIVPVEGCASGSPVSGDWIFGTYLPMPKPFSRIQLDCTRLLRTARAGEHEAGEQHRDLHVTRRQRAEVGALSVRSPQAEMLNRRDHQIARNTTSRPTLKTPPSSAL